MPIDLRRPLRAAIDAALDEALADPPKKKRHGGTGRALLIGAGLFTAGRLVAGGRGRDMLQAIQQRLPDVGASADDDQPEDDEDFDEYGDEPQDEAEDDFDEELEDEAGEDVDEEPEDEADEDVDEPTADDEPEGEGEGEEAEPEAQADEEDEAPADEEPGGEEAEKTPRRRSRGRATTRSRR
jgi:hypothetical protein